MTTPASGSAAPDVRLVPAAVTSWAVTAAGILWGPVASAGVVAGVISIAVATAGSTVWWLRGRPVSARPAVWPSVLAVGVVGIAFAIAVGLRVSDVQRHPITSYVGRTVAMVVTPTESPRFLGGTRMLIRGTLTALDDHRSWGRVVVFASAVEFGDVTAGRPVALRALVGRPERRDLSVAELSATGKPTMGTASTVQQAAARVRATFAEAAREVLPVDQAATLPAVVLGDTAAVAVETTAEFRAAGLTHARVPLTHG